MFFPKALFLSICFFISTQAHSTLTIFMKDPISNDYGVGMISSGPIRDDILKFLMPGEKNLGVTGWGGNTRYFNEEIAQHTLKLISEKQGAADIEKYIVINNGPNNYRYSFMDSNGLILGSVAPSCDNTRNDCGFFIDQERKIMISAGGQEPEVISKTFKRLQDLQDNRLKRFMSGLAVNSFACYLADALNISQEYGAETLKIISSGITLDLEKTDDLVRYSSFADSEDQIVPALKVKIENELGIDCK